MVLLHATAAVLVLGVKVVTGWLIVSCESWCLGDVSGAVLGLVCDVFVAGIVDLNVGNDGDLVVEWFFVVFVLFISLFSMVVVLVVVIEVVVVVAAVVASVSFTSVVAVLFSVV